MRYQSAAELRVDLKRLQRDTSSSRFQAISSAQGAASGAAAAISSAQLASASGGVPLPPQSGATSLAASASTPVACLLYTSRCV